MAQEQSLPRRAILVVNAASRAGEERFDAACAALRGAGIDLTEAHAVKDPEQLGPTVEQAVAKAPMVIIGGGDGTLSRSVDHFLGKDCVFALLPLGTANSFARELAIPLDLDEAVRVIAKGQRRRIDLGAIDGDYFVNTAAIGLSPMIAESVPSHWKKRLGRLAYLLWGLRCAFQFQPFRLRIKDENGAVHRLWSTEVRIANGGHFGGVELVDTARLDSGEIVVEAVDGRSLMRLAWTWIVAALRLRGLSDDQLAEFRGSRFEIRTWPRLYVAIDGETSRRTPIMVEVARAAIDVAAPSLDIYPSRDNAAESRSTSAERSA